MRKIYLLKKKNWQSMKRMIQYDLSVQIKRHKVKCLFLRSISGSSRVNLNFPFFLVLVYVSYSCCGLIELFMSDPSSTPMDTKADADAKNTAATSNTSSAVGASATVEASAGKI